MTNDKAPKAQTLMPYITCANAADALAFYSSAFGAKELYRIHGSGGMIVNASMAIGDCIFMLMDENLTWGAKGPKVLGGTPVTLHLTVPDVDALFAQAVAAGARERMPVADQFWGDRYGLVEDPFGHSWSIATPVKEMSVAEMQAACDKAMAG